MSKRILFVTGEGIGNVIQTIPTIRTIKEVISYEVDFWHAFGSFPIQENIIPYIDNWFCGAGIRNAPFGSYEGVVSTFWTRDYIKPIIDSGIRLMNNITPLSMDRSEVDIYLDIARDLGVEEINIIWDGSCSYERCVENITSKIDIILHDGYNPYGSANWKIKSYPYYKEVVSILNGYDITVASVGSNKEYIEGTVDFTGLPLLKTFGCLREASLFVGNDSGLYHVANALNVPNVVVFTATSVAKNYDPRFHRHSTIFGREDLTCRPCQSERRWAKDCTSWECREIDPKELALFIIEELNKVKIGRLNSAK